PEEQRADQLAPALLVPAEARHDAVGRAHVLDLDHHALAGLVEARLVLGDHPVEPGALEAMEPFIRDRPLPGARGEVDAPPRPGERPLEAGAAGGLAPRAEIPPAPREAVG